MIQIALTALEFRIKKENKSRIGSQSRSIGKLSQAITGLLLDPLKAFDGKSADLKISVICGSFGNYPVIRRAPGKNRNNVGNPSL